MQITKTTTNYGAAAGTGFAVADIFYLLSDPTRLRIIQTLSKIKEMCVSNIQSETSVTISAVSHQLAMLEARGIVKKCRYGRTICYCMDKKNLITKKILKILKIIS